MPSLVLYQPDIPQNLGAILRIGACFSMGVHVVEPCGFPLDDKRMKRSGMDYVEQAVFHRHASWEAFLSRRDRQPGRLVLLTTRASESYHGFSFQADDYLLFGRESSGVPEEIHTHADARLRIPMADGARSLNVAVSAGILAAESLRQLQRLPS